MSTGQKEEIVKTYDAVMENLHDMMDFITEESQKVGFDENAIGKIQLAAEEALVNVIHYAYPEDQTGKIEVICTSEIDESLIIVIKDQGKAFDPFNDGEKVDIYAPEEQRRIGGLGIFIIEQVMTFSGYQRDGDTNILTMKKDV